MILVNQLAVLGPEEIKTVGIVVVMVSAVLGAIVYPIARAYARRLEGSAQTAGLRREELADVYARLETLQQGQERMAELEGRLDFAERLLSKHRDAESLRLPGR
jgi:hypothetical protein